jgi:hypothetical protein
MSIYRKIARDVPGDVPTAASQVEPPEAKVELVVDPAHEEAERSKRSRGAPSNVPLPRTLAWAAGLPSEIRPHELIRSFARIANLLAADWDDRDATSDYFDHLMTDKRGTRKGFPPEIAAELRALCSHYGCDHKLADVWEDARIR